MLLTALCLTFVVFFLTNLEPNLEKLTKSEGNMRMSDAQVHSWLEKTVSDNHCLNVMVNGWVLLPAGRELMKRAMILDVVLKLERALPTHRDFAVCCKASGVRHGFSGRTLPV